MTSFRSSTISTSTSTLNSTTTFTVRKMTGRRISKLSSILLLCAALLLTKSCGILALSGDANSNDLAKAEPWSDTTTIQQSDEESTTSGSGSGDWELTTEAEETTTPSDEEETTSPSDEEETTSPSDEESTTNADQESSSTGASGDGETTTAVPETSPAAPEETSAAPEETSAAPEETSPAPEETTTGEPESSSSSSAPAEPESSSTSSSSSSIPAETTIAPTPPTFKCQTAGLFPHIGGECRRYHNCLLNPVLQQLQEIELICPERTVFSPSLSRCARDLAECQEDGFQCLAVGRFAGHDETYYYSCVASLQGGFHKFIVRCSSGQRFEALIGGCWRYDWTQIVPGQEATEVSDLAAIKRELKLYKAEAKLRLKAQKEQEKLAKKQQKLEEKAAKKAAKEQAKQQAKAEKEKEKAQAKGPESIESAESAE
ncbi:uncharacterized protein Mur18B [Drosophila takahashii]|uniref:uncharacterized protein Mur18B n=1 Tax=Drosophila takahashii TaxID=29030 RepID=UPI00389964D0